MPTHLANTTERRVNDLRKSSFDKNRCCSEIYGSPANTIGLILTLGTSRKYLKMAYQKVDFLKEIKETKK